MIGQLIKLVLLICSTLAPSVAQSIEKGASNSLLTLAASIVAGDEQVNKQREQLFLLELEEQQNLLSKSEGRLSSAELNKMRLKKAFDENEREIANLEAKLNQRSGSLGEVFGVAKKNASELSAILLDSVTSADNPGRAAELAFADAERVPTFVNMLALMKQLSLELESTGEISRFASEIIGSEGIEETQTVTRYGVFASLTEQGEYLAWDVPGQVLKTLRTQPGLAVSTDDKEAETSTVLLDPSRGELFDLLDQTPSLLERIKQGGLIGYVILTLGVVGLLLAIYQMTRLALNEAGVRRQLKSLSRTDLSNPLGRVLSSLQEIPTESKYDNDDLIEMRVDEAILKELPRIEQGQSFLKLLAAIAPLLGLLGTVLGMILTFQSITIFGTSDPKLMASGISQALMTTVLGLVVAVPILFFHSVLASRGQAMVQVLQEKSLAAVISMSEMAVEKDSGENSELVVI